MSTLAQTGHTFLAELKDIGIEIPPDTTAIVIKADGSDVPVTISFEYVCLNNIYTKSNKHEILKDKNGGEITSTQLFNLIKDVVDLPKETTAFEIRAEANKIVEINIKAAFPQGALSSLKGIL